jgi:hypothetical protein
MHRFVIGVLLLVVQPVHAAEPYRYGRLGERLTTADVTAVGEAVGPATQLWAIFGWYSRVLAEVRHVDAFLPPTTLTDRIMRGLIVHLHCTPVDGACRRWVKEPDSGAYVQVPDLQRRIAPDNPIWRELEKPIRLRGEFADEGLLGLVRYIRSGPGLQLSPGRAVSTDLPIQDIEQQADASIWVTLTRDGLSGETATVVRTPRGWRVTDLVNWVV